MKNFFRDVSNHFFNMSIAMLVACMFSDEYRFTGIMLYFIIVFFACLFSFVSEKLN